MCIIVLTCNGNAVIREATAASGRTMELRVFSVEVSPEVTKNAIQRLDMQLATFKLF